MNARRHGFNEEMKVANIGTAITGALSNLGGAAIRGGSRLAYGMSPQAGKTVSGLVSRGTTALGGRKNLQTALGAGVAGVGLLGAGAAAHKLAT